MNILEALADEAPAPSTRACKVQRWLNAIDPETAHIDALVRAIVTTDPKADGYRTVAQTCRILWRLDKFKVSTKTLGDHRARRCPCFD